MTEKLLFRTRMRPTDREIVRALERTCIACWHNMHEYRRKFRQTGDKFWQQAAEDTRMELRELLSIRRGR
jgi:hypothetical protein